MSSRLKIFFQSISSRLNISVVGWLISRNQSWIFVGRTDAEGLIFWLPEAKNWLIGKGPSAGKDWRQEENGITEDKMVGWHHQLDGHEFEQALGVGDGQGSLAGCIPWGHKELDMTERLNWTELRISQNLFYQKFVFNSFSCDWI